MSGLIVVTPNRDRWNPFRWTPCRARLPLMVQYGHGAWPDEWFRDGFDPETPLDRELGVTRVGIVLWFGDSVERTTWGVVLGLLRLDDVADHELRQLIRDPSWNQVRRAAEALGAENFIETIYTEAP